MKKLVLAALLLIGGCAVYNPVDDSYRFMFVNWTLLEWKVVKNDR